MKNKFRVYHPDENAIYYFSNFEEIVNWQHGDGYRVENDEDCQVIYMQSTGLQDKNGVEIFEGDVVENTTQTVYLGHKFEVTWNKNYAVYQLMNNGATSNIPLIQDFMSYEVIGNIYENKDLSGVENE